MIHLIDYGIGNIQAFLNTFKRLGIKAKRVSTPEELCDATHLILPGVGAFDHAMNLFNNSGMRDKVEEMVLIEKIPVLGICVGMQMLAAGSDEGNVPGLNWIPGRVRSFSANNDLKELPLPHMGWNDVNISAEHPLLKNFANNLKFYFLHSYYFECDNAEHAIAKANYGFDFDCIIASGNVFGIQCHPEKSHSYGVQLLKNFSEIELC